MIADKGARYGFFFHYMPVGNNAVPELMPTVEQRAEKWLIKFAMFVLINAILNFIRWISRMTREFVGGCIAGGRNYFHINASGDAANLAYLSIIPIQTFMKILFLKCYKVHCSWNIIRDSRSTGIT